MLLQWMWIQLRANRRMISDQVKTKDVKRHHFASNLNMRYITGAKFEQHHSNISRDILCTETSWDVINFSARTLISLEREKIFKTSKHHSCSLLKAFQLSIRFFFLLYRYFFNN